MNFDAIENLSYQNISLLYDDIIENTITIVESFYCERYCTCSDGRSYLVYCYHTSNVSNNSGTNSVACCTGTKGDYSTSGHISGTFCSGSLTNTAWRNNACYRSR